MRRSTGRILRDATPEEVAHWNYYIVNNPDGGSILQTSDFAVIKQHQGWKVRYLILSASAQKVAILVLEKHIPFLGLFWYIPKGPALRGDDDWKVFAREVRAYLRPHRLTVFFIKVEPEIPDSPEIREKLKYAGFIESQAVQANTSSIILRIQDTPEAQLDALGRRARRYIRRAQRENIAIRTVPATDANCRQMYALMGTAFGGRGIPGLRPFDYYRHFWQSYEQSGAGELYFTFDDTTVIAGVFVIVLGKTAVYKDGGSIPDSTSGGTYAIHWHIMNEVAKRGVEQYDLWGSPPSYQLNNEQHPLWGVGNFKTAFSKTVIDYVGGWDLVLKPSRHALWIRAYSLIRRLYRMRGRSFW